MRTAVVLSSVSVCAVPKRHASRKRAKRKLSPCLVGLISPWQGSSMCAEHE